jgi:hypothetical protein
MTPADVLAFERRRFLRPGAKERAVLETFGVPATRYYQRLNAVLDDPASLQVDAPTVRRLQRLRATRLHDRGHV